MRAWDWQYVSVTVNGAKGRAYVALRGALIPHALVDFALTLAPTNTHRGAKPRALRTKPRALRAKPSG